jgi:hypothetical protein
MSRGTRSRRRNVEVAGLSFLDAICCGFGAIILLLVLTKFAEPVIIEQTTEQLDAIIRSLEEELVQIRGETKIANAALTSRKEQLSEDERRLARLQGDLSRIQGEFAASDSNAAVSSTIAGQLAEARQRLTLEMQRLQSAQQRASLEGSLVGGIPVDSEYIIFIIDTSGSMQNFSWRTLLRKINEVLDAYPRVKGIQVMNDMGAYLFARFRNKWIPDTPARRRGIISSLSSWQPFSNSSPVEGITKAIQTFWAPDKKISIYVFGDEFTGRSIEEVVRTVDRINRADAQGNRRVRIHAIGFPYLFSQPENMNSTGVRFATLMRALCYRNGGTFVGLTEF